LDEIIGAYMNEIVYHRWLWWENTVVMLGDTTVVAQRAHTSHYEIRDCKNKGKLKLQ